MECTLKNRLAECLVAKNIKKSQLAYRFGLSRAHVTRLVNGGVQPSIGLALRLAKYFGRPVESIFQLGDETISRPVSAASGNSQPRREQPKE